MGQGILRKPRGEVRHDAERADHQWQEPGPTPAGRQDDPAEQIEAWKNTTGGMSAPSRTWATPSATTTIKSPTSITPSRTERPRRSVVVPVPVGETLVADTVITP